MAKGPLHGIEDTFARWGIALDTSDVVPGTGKLFVPDHVMVHHDASRPGQSSHRVIRTGRPDVPPPLYQIYVTRDLRVELASRGRANHAGKGGPWHDLGVDQGNRRAVGVCVAHAGRDPDTGELAEAWDPDLVDLFHRSTAAVCDHLGIDASLVADRVLGHKEYTGRKPDPELGMTTFRRRVAHLLTAAPPGKGDHGGTPTPTPTPGGDMIDAQGLRELLETTKVGLGPANGRLLASGLSEITLDGLLVALAGHTAAQSQQLERIADALEALAELAPAALHRHVPAETALEAELSSDGEQGGPAGG